MSDYIVLTDCTTITNNHCLKCRKLGVWGFVPIGLVRTHLWDPDDAKSPGVSPPDQFLGTNGARPPIGYRGADISKFSLPNYTSHAENECDRSTIIALIIRPLVTSAKDFRLMDIL